MPPPNQPANTNAATINALTGLTAAIKSLTEQSKAFQTSATGPNGAANAISAIGQAARNSAAPMRVFGQELESFTKRFQRAVDHAKTAWQSLVAAFSDDMPGKAKASANADASGAKGGKGVGQQLDVIINQLGGIFALLSKKLAGEEVQTAEEEPGDDDSGSGDDESAEMGAIARWKKVAEAIIHATEAAVAFTGAVAGVTKAAAEGGARLLSGPLHALDAGISAISSNVTKFVSQIDPSAIFRFHYALDSLYATIGSALVPVLNTFTDIIKSIASAIAGAGDQGHKVLAAIAAGTVGLIAFAAAMAIVEAVATGGLMPIIGAIVGALGGMALATGALQPLIQALSTTLSGMLGQLGGLLDVATQAFMGFLPVIEDFAKNAAGFLSYLADATQRMMPALSALTAAFFSIVKPMMLVGEILASVFIEGFVMLGNVLKYVAPIIGLIGDIFTATIQVMMDAVKKLFALVGIEVDTDFGNRAPKGGLREPPSPVRQASFGGVEDVLKKALSASFSLGSGSDPAKTTAANTGMVANNLVSLRNEFAGLSEWIKKALPHYIAVEAPKAVGGFFREAFGSVGRGVTETAKGAGNFVERNFNDGVKFAESMIPGFLKPS